MIKLHAENRDILSLVCRGPTLEVAAEIGLSINRICSGLYKSNTAARERYVRQSARFAKAGKRHMR